MMYSLYMPVCAYGCEREAIKFFVTTKRWCCSNSVNSCPAKCERDACQKRGKNPFESREHPKPWLGKKSWNHGLLTPNEVREKIRIANRGNPKCTGKALTIEKEELRCKRIHETAKRNGKTGGYRRGSGVGKKCWYDSPIAGRVHLQSTYELRLAQILDSLGLIWCRTYDRFPYPLEGKSSYYIPDFKIFNATHITYVETKGYIPKKDEAKWSAFPEKLLVLRLNEIESLEKFGDVAERFKASTSKVEGF